MIVIADDITGAAEIAGIAFSCGQPVRLLCGDTVAANGTTVVATDTRSLSASEAAAETLRLASHLSPLASHLFKKTDSALRGHVVEELTALMEATGYQRTVFLPANPSKGRIIRGGVYYIKEVCGESGEVRDVPLHETAFSYDPEFPATTSVLQERFPDAESKGIIMPDAESEDDIRRVVVRYDDGKTLFAGAADLFKVLLEVRSERRTVSDLSPLTSHPSPLTKLILCGSTQSKPLDIGIPIYPMPREVYDGVQTAQDWYNAIASTILATQNCQLPTVNCQLSTVNSLILSIPHTHRTGKAIAVHLRTVMAEMTRLILAPLHLESTGTGSDLHLIIEGGATAWATLQALGWKQFEIVRQVAPGVVQMRAECGALVTLKPGSYPWGPLLEQ